MSSPAVARTPVRVYARKGSRTSTPKRSLSSPAQLLSLLDQPSSSLSTFSPSAYDSPSKPLPLPPPGPPLSETEAKKKREEVLGLLTKAVDVDDNPMERIRKKLSLSLDEDGIPSSPSRKSSRTKPTETKSEDYDTLWNRLFDDSPLKSPSTAASHSASQALATGSSPLTAYYKVRTRKRELDEDEVGGTKRTNSVEKKRRRDDAKDKEVEKDAEQEDEREKGESVTTSSNDENVRPSPSHNSTSASTKPSSPKTPTRAVATHASTSTSTVAESPAHAPNLAASSPSSSPATTPKRQGALKQMYLDFGQKRFDWRSCPDCEMVYAPGVPADEAAHRKFHKKKMAAPAKLTKS